MADASTPERPARLYIPDARPHDGEAPPLVEALRGTPSHSALMYARRAFVETPTLDDADGVLAPWTILEYKRRKRFADLRAVAAAAESANVPVLVYTGLVDDDIRSPVDAVTTVAFAFERVGRRKVLTLPAWIDDPLETVGGEWEPAPFTDKPRVGFCGQTSSSTGRTVERVARNLGRYARSVLGGAYLYPQSTRDYTRLRRACLDAALASSDVEANFIEHRFFHGGVYARDPEEERLRVRLEFLRNILDTGYTVCVRGKGNFSIRLFETMACGRIPIYVESGSPLPFEDTLPWDDLVVRVPAAKPQQLPLIVRDLHRAMGPDGFRERQARCRETWKQWLAKPTFYAAVARELVSRAAAARGL